MGIGEPVSPPSVRLVRASRRSTKRRPSLAVSGRIRPSDIDGLCDDVRTILARPFGDARSIDLDVGSLAEPDVAAIDALARIQLTTRRLGIELELCGVCPELRELIGLLGLAEVLALDPGSAVESRWQAEEREEPLGVEEERDP